MQASHSGGNRVGGYEVDVGWVRLGKWPAERPVFGEIDLGTSEEGSSGSFDFCKACYFESLDAVVGDEDSLFDMAGDTSSGPSHFNRGCK